MAKASQADIDAAIELFQFLQAMSSGRSCPDVVDEFGYKGYGDLLEREATDVEFALRAHERGGLFRVVWGMQTLLDPANEVVDPNLPHLELHPKHALAEREREDLCKAKNEAIDQRDELLAAVMDGTAEFREWQECEADAIEGQEAEVEHDHNRMLAALKALRRKAERVQSGVRRMVEAGSLPAHLERAERNETIDTRCTATHFSLGHHTQLQCDLPRGHAELHSASWGEGNRCQWLEGGA